MPPDLRGSSGHPRSAGRVRRHRRATSGRCSPCSTGTSRSSSSSTASSGCSAIAIRATSSARSRSRSACRSRPVTAPSSPRASCASRPQDYHAIARGCRDVAVKVGEIARGRIGGLQHIVAEPPAAARARRRRALRPVLLRPAAVPRPQRDHVRVDPEQEERRADGDPLRRRRDDRRSRRSAQVADGRRPPDAALRHASTTRS